MPVMKLSRARVMGWLDRFGTFDLVLRARARTQAPVLSVLCYHSIGDPDAGYCFDPDVIDATPEQFWAHLSVLDRHFTVIGIDTLCAGLAGGTLPPNPLLISFDDGYRSCVDTALPILQEFGFPATFFIATHYVSERRLYWWDRIAYLLAKSPHQRITLTYPEPIEVDLSTRGLRAQGQARQQLLRVVKQQRDLDLERFLSELGAASGVAWDEALETRLANQLIMTWDDVRELGKAGMDIQSHTRKHRVLQTLSSDRLAEELAGSRADIARELGRPARTVAYPVGYSIRDEPEIRRAVQDAGYELGFTAGTGFNYLWRKLDAFDVRRISMERDCSMSLFRGQLAVPPLAYVRGG